MRKRSGRARAAASPGGRISNCGGRGSGAISVDSCRAVFVPLQHEKMPRLWKRSGVFEGAHVQVCVRAPRNILAVWSVRKDGRYGEDE
jgi:hypothetical protein